MCACVCVVSEAEVKVAEWQKTYYAADSGIQSGATTVNDEDQSQISNKTFTVEDCSAGMLTLIRSFSLPC